MENQELDTVVWFGGEVKALDDSGRVGGYLVRFSTANDPDLAGDYFTADTDFGPIKSSPILYHHGMDATLKGTRLGLGELKTDDVGVWLEGQLELRDDYEKAIFQMAKAGKLGWSSGTASHLVTRKSVGNATEILSWPLGLDASLTPTPCEPRTQAVPLKSIQDIEGIALTEDAELESSEAGSTEAPGTVAVAPAVDESAAAKSITDTADEATEQPLTMENQETPQEQAVSAEAPVQVEQKAASLTDSLTISREEYDQYKALEVQAKAFSQEPAKVVKAAHDVSTANINLKTGLGDSEAKAVAHWVRTGDMGAVGHMKSFNETGNEWFGTNNNTISFKASNDTSMNIGTPADGGNAVPTGHFQEIIARRDEAMISSSFGVRNIPGKGTTVNVPVDAEDDGEFPTTAEEAASDRDAPALGTVAMTLVRKTKRIELTDELMQDEDSGLLTFISDFVGRGMAKTHNNVLLTEVAANGTNFTTLAGVGAVADGEIEDIEGDDNLGGYLDDFGSVGWVMRNSTLSNIRKISGNDRVYSVEGGGGPGVRANRTLLGYPVLRSNQAPALGASNKPIYFGNWFYVGVRNEPEFRVLRDPYSQAANGKLVLHYYFRLVYKVLQAEAIGYATNAAS